MHMLQNQIQNDRRNRFISLIFIALLTVGLMFPTSSGSIISENIYKVTPVLFGLFLCVLIPMVNKIKFHFVASFIIINAFLWLVTFFRHPAVVDYGTSILIAMFTLMFCINFKKIDAKRSVFICFNIVTVTAIAIAWAMVFKLQQVANFFINHYNDFYPELVPLMLKLGKPVLVFGTHSVAAFYMFIFFYLNIKTYETSGKKRYYVFAINFLVFCYLMNSNTGIIFLVLGVLYLIYKSEKKLLWMIAFSLGLAYILYSGSFNFREFFIIFDPSKSGNGLLGRYSGHGNLQSSLNYIFDNPLSAMGYSADFYDKLTFHDSGLISIILRGTLVFAILFYCSLFLFFRINMNNKLEGLLMFVVFFMFEIGFNNLFYFRTLFILPFIILYLNYLEKKKIEPF
ncbi:hypothetical protein [Paenibacillus sp. sgz500992]|uniref:hypothetical protein n=1 Tax=Paenibacillus sp. sgz500992 TaxID=3242476 RepID=UPI0036D3D3AB